MDNKQLEQATMKTLRNTLMGAISDIRNGNATAQEGVAIAKIGNVLVSSYRADIEAVKVVNDLKEHLVFPYLRDAEKQLPSNLLL